MYDRCVTHANIGVPWCPTAVNSSSYEVIPNSKENCIESTKVNDCPIGFRWVYSEATCYRVKIHYICC